MGRVRIGISGWRYAGWRGRFYPKGLAQSRELEFAARHFESIEINGSFYSLQRPEYYRAWYDETPPGFVFAVKGGRFITHMKKLRDVRAPLANFFASGLACLGEKLGPILWQLPAQVRFERERFEAFFELLPRDGAEASRLARKHDARVTGRAALSFPPRAEIRHALELRSPSPNHAELVDVLRRHDVSLVVADTAGRFPYFEEATSDFTYVRLHGDEELYTSGYSPAALRTWAERVRSFASERDVYVYFDNDAKVHAPFDAIALDALVNPRRARAELELRGSSTPRSPKRRGAEKPLGTGDGARGETGARGGAAARRMDRARETR